MLIVLPALWQAPGDVFSVLSGNANYLDEALRPTFFMGQIAFDHGYLFYPVVLLWRNGPVVVAAVIPFILLLIHWKRVRTGRSPALTQFSRLVSFLFGRCYLSG
ncbi:MAG: hypothetical protein R3C44_05150 [Chloroflexota bacterium]